MAGTGTALGRPAKNLLGLTLDGGWKVTKLLPRLPDATGSNFCVGYIVDGPGGRKGFLKALDYSRAFELRPDQVAAELEKITKSINFEREILAKCKDGSLDRVVTALSSGAIHVPGTGTPDLVEYLIFELATCDARRYMDAVQTLEVVWKLRALHHIATGLDQLHRLDIAHQDVKPSNVLMFPRDVSKLADLGRSACKGLTPPHQDYPIGGDPTYAPPELLYNYISTEWNPRRFGCDAYHLGSMVAYFFTSFGMTGLLFSALPYRFHYRQWGGTYQEVLPYMLDAFAQSLDTLAQQIPPAFRDELIELVRQLCNPDPLRRGHPKNRTRFGNPGSGFDPLPKPLFS